MYQLQGFQIGGKEDLVYRLVKAVYGSKPQGPDILKLINFIITSTNSSVKYTIALII